MNREVYALQLIDEETGEVLKDVTPITESKSVIHDGEKLSEVLDLQRDKIQEQSKSNLVLVTTMQKLLSEKIDKLEREKDLLENQPLNIVKSGRVTSWTESGECISKNGFYIINPDKDAQGRCAFAINDAHGKYEVIPKPTDTVYTMVKLNKKINLKCHYWGTTYKSPEEVKELDDGFLYLFKHIGTDRVKETWAFNEKIDFLMDSNITVTLNEKPTTLIKNDYRWGVTESLNFYKSQLEKLKLTQEVDLNLLLTL